MNNAAGANGLDFCRLCHDVRGFIDQRYRYAHSVRVARVAAMLAHCHGVDVRQARLAGLLHDLTRLWSKEKLIQACETRGIPIDDFSRAHPVVLHAPLGAAIAQERYGISETGILNAIARHTVGAATMTPLDSVVFIADALEPGREFAERRDMLEFARVDLAGGLHAVYLATKTYLEARGLTLSPQLAAALANYERTAP